MGDYMTEKTVFLKVEEENLACSMGSGSLRVLATPAVVALMEYAASSLASDILQNSELTTVGTQISIEHTSPTPIAAEVTATARLVEEDGRVFRFEVSASDKKGEIARGTHTRVSVKAEKFQAKADAKFNKYRYVLFDLDGTISQSAEGIRASLEHAINELEADMPDLNDYTLYIGPPLIDTFKTLVGLDDERAEIGSELYRSYYQKRGKLLNRAYDGVEDLLKLLKNSGFKLAVCTSKYEPFAQEIIEILGLNEYFDAVCGSNIDGSRKDKCDLIPYAVEQLGGDFERDRKKTVMLGDTYFDARGAKQCGVDFIGIAYGYGTVEAMKAEGASVFVDSPSKIEQYLY